MTNTQRLKAIHKFDQTLAYLNSLPIPVVQMIDVVLDDGVVVVTPRDLIHHEICLTDCLCCPCWCH